MTRINGRKHLLPLALIAALLSGFFVSPSLAASNKLQTSELMSVDLKPGAILKGSKLTLTPTGKASDSTVFRYTTDGSTPTKSSPQYTAPIVIDKNMTIQIMAVDGNTSGSVERYAFTVYSTRLGSLRSDAASKRYMAGYENGYFFPDQAATRYEVAEALTYLLELGDGSTASPFPDMHSQHAAAVSRLVEAGLINGLSDGLFHGESGLTRAQLCKILCLVLDYKEEPQLAERSFSDVEGHWAIGYIGALVKSGYLNGYTDGTFRPDRTVTRAEFVALLNRVAGRKNVEGDILEYVDVLLSFWAYDDVHNAAL